MWMKKKYGENEFFFSCLDWGKNIRIWMRNLNVDKLLESCWCHLSKVRLEEVGNFPQTFITILWEKFYHLFLTIFPPKLSSIFFFFVIFSKPNTKKKSNFPKKISFHQIFQGPNGTLVYSWFSMETYNNSWGSWFAPCTISCSHIIYPEKFCLKCHLLIRTLDNSFENTQPVCTVNHKTNSLIPFVI